MMLLTLSHVIAYGQAAPDSADYVDFAQLEVKQSAARVDALTDRT